MIGLKGGRAVTERSRIELALPAHLLALMAHELRRQGWELRSDIGAYLNNAAVLPLTGLDDLRVSLLAKKIDDTAKAMLHELAPDDARQGLLAVAQFVAMLVDEAVFDDARNPAVLTALLLLDEAREDPGKDEPDWAYDEARLQRLARPLLTRTRLLGLYCRQAVAASI